MTGAGDVREWLKALGLGKYVEAFVENDVDLDVLPDLKDADLMELGISLGHRKKILRAVGERLETHAGAPERAPANAPVPVEAEHRQLTVMFVDLVGSTALSRRLEPEDLRDILRSYQNAVSGEVTRFDGYIASFMGDGVLAYFGWPKAFEDQADRAVHAAFGIVEAVRALKFSGDMKLDLRVGIASGQVVVGDLIGEGGSEVAAVTGETPNLASRLQEFAMPGQIVISDSTKRLVGNAFELHGMGSRMFKGFAEPIPVWRPLGAKGAKSRFESMRGGNVLPLIGRKPEIGLLLDRWEMAKSGSGQAVFVSGEAGIGKSRLVQALRERFADEPHFRVRCQASPHHTASALHPMARQLEQAAGFDIEDAATEKRQKLEQLLRLSQDDIIPHLQVLAPLLSIPLGSDDIVQALAADQLRERTIEAFIEQLIGLSRRRPTMFVFEDAHWMDPSTAEVVTRMTQRIADEAVLVVITHRPEWNPDWAAGYAHVAQLALPRLSSVHAAEMVRSAAGDAADADMIKRIAERTDGVPLFIEELTRSIYEAEENAAVVCEEIPETLQGLLLASLDRLDPKVRELAQVGSVIGREFTRDLLSETLGRSDGLDSALERLMASRLVNQSGSAQSRRYVFRHALIQEAAYSSLLVRRRHEYHEAIAKALKRDLGDGADTPPELVAQHYTAAENVEAAVPWWLQAGKRALERSANVEAVEHLQQGVTLAEELPNGQDKLQLQLELHLGLGNAEVKAGGLQDALRAYNQAARLARLAASGIDLARAAIGFEEGEFYLGQAEDASIVLLEEAMTALGGSETIERCRVLGGLGRAYTTVGATKRAREVTADAVEMARRLGDKRALYESLICEYYTSAAGQTENARRALVELNALAKEIGDWDLIMRAESWRGFHHLQAGDRDQYDESLRVYRTNAEQYQQAIHIWVTTSANAMDAVLDGDFQASERHAEQAFSLGQKMHMENAQGVYGTQMFTIRREQGRLAEVAPIFKKFVDENPAEATWRPGLALIASDLGFLEPARKVFDQMAEDGFKLAHDAKRSATLSYLAEVCARLQDRKRAESLYKILQPYADLTITMGLTTVCYGAAARFLGLLSATFEDWETAAEHFEVAIVKNSELRAWPWLAHSQADYAAMLRARGDRSDSSRIEELLDSASSAAANHDMVMLQGRVAALR